MLVVATRQLRDPVVFFVFVVAGDGLFHVYSLEPESWSRRGGAEYKSQRQSGYCKSDRIDHPEAILVLSRR